MTGVDMPPEMLAKARGAAAEMGVANVDFVAGSAEQAPFGDASFDVVVSNGVIDLIPDEDAVVGEILGVLPRGRRGDRSGNLVATYARSKFDDKRRKAIKLGADGTTITAYKPERSTG